ASKLATSSSERSEVEEDVNEKNAGIVRDLYDALALGDAKTVHRILAPDLEWWFHGPPHCQHLMRFLAGLSARKRLLFSPQSVTPLGNRVFVEGLEVESQYWVHVWTVENGLVTQLREYFNTSLFVAEFKLNSSSISTSSSGGFPVWQSCLCLSDENSMPALLLAI
ncbi:hypothetical protein KI387_037690, partial [Taxus chinensis]